MNGNVIDQIKTAESKAKGILDSSKEESKEIFNNALTKANEEYEKIINLANEEYRKIISKYEEEAKVVTDSLEKKGGSDVFSICNVSEDKKLVAINVIVERIVSKWL